MLGIFSVGVSFGLGSTDSMLTCLGLEGFLYQLDFWCGIKILALCAYFFVFLVCLHFSALRLVFMPCLLEPGSLFHSCSSAP